MDDKYRLADPRSLMNRLRELDGEQAEIDRERREIIEALVSKVESFTEIASRFTDAIQGSFALSTRTTPASMPRPVPTITSTATTTVTTITLTDEIAKVLSDAPEPMMPAQIADELQKRGVPVGGKRPANNVAAHLSYATRRFVRYPGRGWALREPLLAQQTQGTHHGKENAPH